MELSLKDKVAVVTGASKGMGKAIALALSREGCRVCLVARTEQTLQSAAAEIEEQTRGEVLSLAGDVADPTLAASVVRHVIDRWAAIDILVNNAGGPPPGSFMEHQPAVWAQTIEQNFLSVVRFTREVVPLMQAKKWGRVVNLTSTIAKEPTPSMVLSATARAAVSAFTKAAATELAPYGITVNTICPGGVHTERAENLIKLAAEKENKTVNEILQQRVASIPLQRFASPAEIADVVVFLASARASYLTGVSLVVDGGLTKGIF